MQHAATASVPETQEENPRAFALNRKPADRLFRARSLAAGMTTLIILMLIGLFLQALRYAPFLPP